MYAAEPGATYDVTNIGAGKVNIDEQKAAIGA